MVAKPHAHNAHAQWRCAEPNTCTPAHGRPRQLCLLNRQIWPRRDPGSRLFVCSPHVNPTQPAGFKFEAVLSWLAVCPEHRTMESPSFPTALRRSCATVRGPGRQRLPLAAGVGWGEPPATGRARQLAHRHPGRGQRVPLPPTTAQALSCQARKRAGSYELPVGLSSRGTCPLLLSGEVCVHGTPSFDRKLKTPRVEGGDRRPPHPLPPPPARASPLSPTEASPS